MYRSDEEWRKILSEKQYNILRKKHTEPPFSGEHLYNKKKGVYKCAGCSAPLFLSADKYDSESGWPSFAKPMDNQSIETEEDLSLGMHRVEVHCKNCGGHLGHVFEDGPAPTNLRYCINSCALNFEKNETK